MTTSPLITLAEQNRSHPLPLPQAGEFAQSVPRRLVHRAALHEVLLTHAHRDHVDTWTVGAQWPRSHAFFERIDGAWHDPLIAAETLRQAGLLVSHLGYGVPEGYHFLIHRLGYRLAADQLRDTGAPADVLVRLHAHDARLGSTGITRMRLTYDLCLADGSPLGSGEAAFRVVGPRGYARLRPPERFPTAPSGVPVPAPVDPTLVGRDRPTDTVLAPPAPGGATGGPRWRLRVDRDHPVLFDHPVDHVPGMLLAEAARQAVQAANQPTRVLPTAMTCDFHQYVEFDSPCDVTVGRLTDDTFEVVADQDGERRFSARVSVRALPSDAAEGTVPCGS